MLTFLQWIQAENLDVPNMPKLDEKQSRTVAAYSSNYPEQMGGPRRSDKNSILPPLASTPISATAALSYKNSK